MNCQLLRVLEVVAHIIYTNAAELENIWLNIHFLQLYSRFFFYVCRKMHISAFSKLAVHRILSGAIATLLSAFSLILENMQHMGKVIGICLLENAVFT